MRFHPDHIIFKAFSRYLKGKKRNEFLQLPSKFKKETSKHFYNAMINQFDIEQLRFSPIIWEDI
jgi:hypothetical protein